MQRILHITGKMDRAGAETMVMNLYRAINRSKFQFDFVVFTNKTGDYDEEIKVLGGNIYTILETNPIKRMFALKNLLIEHPEYKIIHSHTLFSSSFHLLAAKLANVPCRIAHSHNTSAQGSNKFISRIYHTLSRKALSKYASHYIACGSAAARFLFPNQKEILLLPNSIDTTQFSRIGGYNKEYLNTEFNINDTYLKIIQVGRLQNVKNHLFSIRVAEKLKELGIPFKLFFVGQGELSEDLKAQIEQRKLVDEVLLLGVRSDIPYLMAGADVMLMPSLHEGFPVVMVEAQAVGIPSVISDTISAEVDLNVGLVEFESLDASLEIWADKLIKSKASLRLNQHDRLESLAKQGFDIQSSVRFLSKLYGSMR